MKTSKSKKEFIRDMEKHIEVRKTMLKFIQNVYFPTMATFNGKVYDIAFIEALREEASKMNELFHIKERVVDHIEIQLRDKEWASNQYESIYLRCNLTDDGRIDYESTINDKLGDEWLNGFSSYMEEYQKSIDNYDKYMGVFEELANDLNEYNALPRPFREHINTRWMKIY